MSDKDELSEFMQEYGNDYSTTLTMGQLQHLVNEKNAAQARIQELEDRLAKMTIGYESMSELVADIGAAIGHVPDGQNSITEMAKSLHDKCRRLEVLCDNYNSMCSQQDERIKQLEARVERLRWCAKAAIDWIDSVPSDAVLPAMPGFDRDEFDAIIDETPAQSLEAKNWEAAEKLDQIVDSN